MDINIEAPNHPNQIALKSYYSKKLNGKFGHLRFIQNIDVKIIHEKNAQVKVSIHTKPEGGKSLYAEHIDNNESIALREVIRKLNHQLDRHRSHQRIRA